MVETRMLFMDDVEANYVREWDARVVKRKKDYVVLDASAFYPEGGGQPADHGTLEWEGGSAPVRHVRRCSSRASCASIRNFSRSKPPSRLYLSRSARNACHFSSRDARSPLSSFRSCRISSAIAATMGIWKAICCQTSFID